MDDNCVIVAKLNVEQSEQIQMASIECSIKFRLSCYSSFEA